MEKIRKKEFVNLYLKDIYEKINKIRKEKNDSDPIDFMEIIDFCVDRKHSEELFDLLDLIYKELKTFVTDEEKKRFKESKQKIKDEAIKLKNN